MQLHTSSHVNKAALILDLPIIAQQGVAGADSESVAPTSCRQKFIQYIHSTHPVQLRGQAGTPVCNHLLWRQWSEASVRVNIQCTVEWLHSCKNLRGEACQRTVCMHSTTTAAQKWCITTPSSLASSLNSLYCHVSSLKDM